MGVHLKITVSIYNCDMMMAGIQLFKKAFTSCKKKKKKAEKVPLLPSQNALGGISYSSLFFSF
jgi:hypothetical protein